MKMDILRARQFFADFFYGENHLPSKIKACGEGWYVLLPGEIASTDFNDMTRLVLMAHERSIRVSVRPLNFRYMKLMLHQRDPAVLDLSYGHPDLDEAIQRHENWKNNHKYKLYPTDNDTVFKPKDVPVLLKNKEGKPLQEFDTQVECAKWVGVKRAAVNNALKRGSLLLGKYYVSKQNID